MQNSTLHRQTPAADVVASTSTSAPRGSCRVRSSEAPTDLRLVELWNRCAGGDSEESWQDFVQEIQKTLRRPALRLLSRLSGTGLDSDRVDDWLQEVLLRLLKRDKEVLRRSRFGHDAALRTFLVQMLRRVAYDDLRHRRRMQRKAALAATDSAGTAAFCEVSTPEQAYLARESLRRFAKHCDEVADTSREPERNRQIWRMTWLDGRAGHDVGRRVGLSPPGVYAVVSRFRRQLARHHDYRIQPGSRA